MSILTKRPWLVFGLGFAAGFYAHEHRKEIIGAAVQGAEAAKQAFLRQAEYLEAIVAIKHH